MKKQVAFLGAAAAALMVAGTAHADGGYVGLRYSDNNDTDISSWGINGAFAAQNFQFDAGYRDLSDVDANAWNIGAHLFSRGDTWLWGGYVGYDTVSGGGTDINEWTAALQTQYYMPRTTLSGNLAYSDTEGDLRLWQIDGEARFFATDNFSLQGNLGWGNLSGGGGDSDLWNYGVGAEWQANSFPVSIYAGWQGYNFDGGGDTSAWEVGVRYNWGGTLLERNRSGAGLGAPHGFLATLFN